MSLTKEFRLVLVGSLVLPCQASARKGFHNEDAERSGPVGPLSSPHTSVMRRVEWGRYSTRKRGARDFLS